MEGIAELENYFLGDGDEGYHCLFFLLCPVMLGSIVAEIQTFFFFFLFFFKDGHKELAAHTVEDPAIRVGWGKISTVPALP